MDTSFDEFAYDDITPSYRSLNLHAMPSTSFGGFEDEWSMNDEEPVYRSMGLVTPMTNTLFESTVQIQSKYADTLRDIKVEPRAHITCEAIPSAVSNSQIQSEPKELCVLYALEQTHLVIFESLSRIFETITQTLQDMGAIFEFKALKHKFKCHLHSRNATIPFHVRIFKKGQGYIVEVQKRSGCSVQFRKVWHALCAALRFDHTMRVTPALDAMSCALTTDEVTTATASAVHVHDNHALASLFNMVQSDKLDVQRGALLSLDMLTQDGCAVGAILQDDADDGALHHICRCITTHDDECRSRALSVIANLVATPCQLTLRAEQQLTQAIPAILHILRSMQTSISCLQLHLQCTRALMGMSKVSAMSRALLTREDCNGVLAHKVNQCRGIAFTDRCTSSLTEMAGTVAQNIACAC